jgi:NAD(P)-dependent dehydrogenase (short-subunit alcohol dehydrogenase family)
MHPPRTFTILSRRFPAKRVFITGAASGLGRALALEFAAAGWRLGIADIVADRLAAVARTRLSSAGADAVRTWRATSPPNRSCRRR